VLLFCVGKRWLERTNIEQTGGVLSEFYAQRRTSIKDGIGLVAFILGWFAAAPLAWPYIAAGFDDGGNAAMGVLKFVLIVFAAGIVFGLLGLLLGAAVGMAWERLHRRRRSTRPARTEETTSAAAPESAGSIEVRVPLPGLTFQSTGVTVADYLSLLHLVSREDHDVARATPALAVTTNIGVWHDDKLIGVARVLTDGYFYAALADIVVDPEYQRRGVGRELLNKAYDVTPRGTLYVNARNNSTTFFEHVGCERGTPGFVMRRHLSS
jgi:GNAT superfamily N-acetyltransferase